MKKIVLMLSVIMIGLTGCTGFGMGKTGIVGYTNNGAVDKKEMTELEFERIHYGAAVIQDEDKFLFGDDGGYEFPQVITTEEDWELLQEKLNIEMEDIDFDEYVVFGDYQYDLWGKTTTIPIMIEEMAYGEQNLYYGWRIANSRRFEAVNKEDKLCGFDLVKIKREDFPMESRDIFGASMKDEEMDDDTTIQVEDGGYYLLQ